MGPASVLKTTCHVNLMMSYFFIFGNILIGLVGSVPQVLKKKIDPIRSFLFYWCPLANVFIGA